MQDISSIINMLIFFNSGHENFANWTICEENQCHFDTSAGEEMPKFKIRFWTILGMCHQGKC